MFSFLSPVICCGFFYRSWVFPRKHFENLGKVWSSPAARLLKENILRWEMRVDDLPPRAQMECQNKPRRAGHIYIKIPVCWQHFLPIPTCSLRAESICPHPPAPEGLSQRGIYILWIKTPIKLGIKLTDAWICYCAKRLYLAIFYGICI